MKQLRILSSAIESKQDAKSSNQTLALTAEVGSEAVEEAAALLKRKEVEDPEEEAKQPKLPKLSLEARRNRKVKADLTEGARVLGLLQGSELRHCGELVSNLERNLKLLREAYTTFAQASLDSDIATEEAWAAVAKVSVEVSTDISEGTRRLNPAAKPYTTPFDQVLA